MGPRDAALGLVGTWRRSAAWRWLLQIVALVALAGLALAGCNRTKGSGKVSSESRDVSGFTEVEVGGAVKLELTVGEAHACKVTADDNLLPLIETVVEGKRLVIRTKGNLAPSESIRVAVSAPDITAIHASGAIDGRATGLHGDALDVHLNGAGELRVEGATKKLGVHVSGAGTLDVRGLAADEVRVSVSGAGKVEVGEPKALDVNVSGAGKVRYGGEPNLSKSISGAGSIDRR